MKKKIDRHKVTSYKTRRFKKLCLGCMSEYLSFRDVRGFCTRACYRDSMSSTDPSIKRLLIKNSIKRTKI